jgi:hypothetical protein
MFPCALSLSSFMLLRALRLPLSALCFYVLVLMLVRFRPSIGSISLGTGGFLNASISLYKLYALYEDFALPCFMLYILYFSVSILLCLRFYASLGSMLYALFYALVALWPVSKCFKASMFLMRFQAQCFQASLVASYSF